MSEKLLKKSSDTTIKERIVFGTPLEFDDKDEFYKVWLKYMQYYYSVLEK